MPDLPSPSPSALARRIDILCDEYDEAWHKNRPPAVPDVLAKAPPAAHPKLFRELLRVEREYRQKAGKPLAADEAHARYNALGPWAAEAIDDLLSADPVLVLEAVKGPYLGQSFRLAGHTTFTIGRLPGLHVSLPQDAYLSRMHCLIEFNPPLAKLIDLESKSGTRVNGERVTSRDLNHGDEVQAGATSLKVRLPVGDAPGTMSFPDGPPAAGSKAGGGPAWPQIPAYTIDAELGRGSMGVVYRARHDDGGVFAVKTILAAMPPTPTALGRFKREADILRRLSHPNIVRFVDTGSAGSVLFFVMECVDGENAEQIVKKQGPPHPDRAKRWAVQLLDALQHAHERKFVHRDVKPSNLMITLTADGEVVKLSDFGLARTYETSSLSGLTVANSAGGTAAFMPPEQVSDFRNVLPAADQYAAAATLHYLVTGAHIYEKCPTIPKLLKKITTEDPIPLRPNTTALPLPFGPVIRRALARDPAARFPDIAAMKRALLGG